MRKISSDLVISESLSEYSRDYSFNGIDLTKFICSILVVMIHVPIFSSQNFELGGYVNLLTQKYICRIAVPFYFVTAGFLLFRKIDLNNIDIDRIKKYCFKMLKLLGLWTVVLSFSNTVHLWYFGGLVVAVLLLSFLLYVKVPVKYIVAISVLLYFVGLAGDSHSYISEVLSNVDIFNCIVKAYGKTFETTRNGVFMGFIFVLMGALFAHKKIIVNFKFAVLGFVLSMGCLLAELFILRRYSEPVEYNMYISLLPAVFFLFYIVTHLNLKDRVIYGKLRVIGVLIFYMHLLVRHFVDLLIADFGQIIEVELIDLSFILTLIFTLLLSISIEKLSHKEKLKWLSLLYT